MQERRQALQPGDVPKMYGDVPPFMAVPFTASLEGVRAEAVVVGMPYDGIATYRGGATRRGPQEVRKFSLLFGGYNLDWDLDAFEHVRVVDGGDVDVVPGDNVESYRRLEARLDQVLAAGAVPLTIGGDHGITYPAVRAVARHGGGPLGLVIFDTHLDLSEALGGDRLTRASPVKRISELEAVDPRRIAIIGARGPRNLGEWVPEARRLGVSVLPIEAVARDGIGTVVDKALAVASPDGRPPYISVDIDAVDPAFAPGTNSPEPGGLTSREIITGVRLAARRGFAGFDVVEVAPDYDTRSGTTSLLAARLLAEAVCCLAAERAGRAEA